MRHVVALPKVIQGPCLANRDDTYMGTCYKRYHFVTVVIIVKSLSGGTQHFAESLSFLWPQIHLYNAMIVLFFIQMSAWRKHIDHRLDKSWGKLRLCCY